MPIINVTSSASSKKEMEQLAQSIGTASDSVSATSVFGKLNDIKNQFTQVWTSDKAAKLDATMTSRAPAGTALSNTVWTNTRAAKVDNLDDKVTSRASVSTALNNTVWTTARATKMDNLDAKISTANTTATNALNKAEAARVAAVEAKNIAARGIIKSIQRGVEYITSKNKERVILINEVDTNKSIVLLNGNMD